VTAVNPRQSLAGPGSTPQGYGRSTEVGAGHDTSAVDRGWMSWSNPSARARQVGDLFQPVTSSEPPEAAIPTQPVVTNDGSEQDGDRLTVPGPQSGSASSSRKWARGGAGLVFGVRGAVIALGASAALVLVLAGVTAFPTSSSAPSSVAAPKPGQLPTPGTSAIIDIPPATVPAADAPVQAAGLIPAQASSPESSPDQPALSTHQQPVPAAHRPVSAPAARTLPAPDPRPVPPPSTRTTTGNAGSPNAPGSQIKNTEPQTTNIEPCNCDDSMRRVPTHWEPPPKTDRQQGVHARNELHETNTNRDREASNKERPGRTVRPDPPSQPDPPSRPRSTPRQTRCPNPASTPNSRGCFNSDET
jgi:hypothetical protein